MDKEIKFDEGFLLRPLNTDDVEGIEKLFSDPDVVKTLAHNTSTPGSSRNCADVWCNSYSLDSSDSEWRSLNIGLWAIVDERTGMLAGANGFVSSPEFAPDSVETFAAFARPYWGRGLYTKTSKLLLDYLFRQTPFNSVYAVLWPLLNPGSEAVQLKMGFDPVKRVTVRESYGESTMVAIRDFELWRLRTSSSGDLDGTLREVGIKFGQLAAEDMFSMKEAIEMVLGALEGRIRPSTDLERIVREHLKTGCNNPAWATYCLTRENWNS